MSLSGNSCLRCHSGESITSGGLESGVELIAGGRQILENTLGQGNSQFLTVFVTPQTFGFPGITQACQFNQSRWHVALGKQVQSVLLDARINRSTVGLPNHRNHAFLQGLCKSA